MVFSYCAAAADGAATALTAGAAVDDGLPGMPLAALPPDTFAAAGGHVLRRKLPIQSRMPFFGNFGILGGKVVETWQHFTSGTIRAAVAALGAAGNHGLVVMTQWTAPPNFAIAGRCDLCRPQRPVFCRVPFLGNDGELAGKVVLAGDNDFSSTDGTTAAIDAAGYAGLPFVAFGALPPDFAARAGDDVCRCKGTVFRGVPFSGQIGILMGKIVVAFLQFFVGTDGAAVAIDTRFDLRPPFVAIGATPPHKPMTAGQQLTRIKAAVFCRMPFLHQFRIVCGQIGFARNGVTSRAIRAACATTCSGINGCAPAVPIDTAPPNVLFAATRYRCRSLREIAYLVPFRKKIFSFCTMAKILQRFSHKTISTLLPLYQNQYFVLIKIERYNMKIIACVLNDCHLKCRKSHILFSHTTLGPLFFIIQ